MKRIVVPHLKLILGNGKDEESVTSNREKPNQLWQSAKSDVNRLVRITKESFESEMKLWEDVINA